MLPRIIINQNLGAIAITSTPAQLELASRKVQMNLEASKPQVQISAPSPSIQIDQTEAFASAGLKGPLRLGDEFAQRSLSAGLDAISTIAAEGLEFLQIEKNSNPIKRQAARAMEQNHQFNVKAMPSARPRVTANLSPVELQWSGTGLGQAEWDFPMARGEYTPYKVEITWLRQPSIEITVEPGTELQFPVTGGVGVNVDEAI